MSEGIKEWRQRICGWKPFFVEFSEPMPTRMMAVVIASKELLAFEDLTLLQAQRSSINFSMLLSVYFSKVCFCIGVIYVKSNSITGWQLGSEPEIQVPNIVANHLTTGILNYIHTTGRYASGINLFEKLRSRDTEISSLLARVLISADEEVQAVKLLHDAIEELPMDYALLDCQSSFCQSKGRLDWALECAKRSVTAAPSEFGTWAKLAEIYVGLEQWDLALLTLNSCPMFTYQDKDAPRMPEPARINLPVLAESILDEIDETPHAFDTDPVHPSLRKLHAATYKGTFLKAYSLLTEITAKIGWDQLLRIRSQVFVMEEEYRSEKLIGSSQSTNHNASTTALRGTPSPGVNGETPHDIANGEENQNGDLSPGTTVAEEATNRNSPSSTLVADSIEKPEHTITSEVVKAGNEEVRRPLKSVFHCPLDLTPASPVFSLPIFVYPISQQTPLRALA